MAAEAGMFRLLVIYQILYLVIRRQTFTHPRDSLKSLTKCSGEEDVSISESVEYTVGKFFLCFEVHFLKDRQTILTDVIYCKHGPTKTKSCRHQHVFSR